jgi:hypothetical protein
MNTHPVLLKLARQGDPRAIAALMNDALREQEIWVKASRHDRSLQIMLKAPRALDQSTCIAFLRWGMARLQSATIDHIHLYAWQSYGDFPDWVTDFALDLALEPSEPQPAHAAAIEEFDAALKISEVAPKHSREKEIGRDGARITEATEPAQKLVSSEPTSPGLAPPELALVRRPAKAVKFGVVVVVALMLYFVAASV